MTAGPAIADSIFLDYVQGLPAEDRGYLISRPSSAFFVFRMLPDVAQQVVLKLIWNSNVMAGIADVASHEAAVIRQHLSLLYAIGIAQKRPAGPIVSADFRKAYLRAAVLGAFGCAGIRIVSAGEEKKAKKDISQNSAERWELVLRYLALPSDQNLNNVSVTTRKLFHFAGFTTSNDELTSAGFQFLLLSPVKQMWTYIVEYLKYEKSQGSDIREILDVLIRIILCVESRSEAECERRAFHLEEDWTSRQNELVMHLRELGLVYIRKRKDGHFFLTPLLANLAVPSDDSDSLMDRKNGMIVVETNFRVYAYTSSSLQLAILSTFTEMTYRFCDMSVGILTRESVRRALMVGITASQIISFLRANAHPQCVAGSGPLHCLPITVADQIRLWEEERSRLSFRDSALYSGFESAREFDGVRGFAAQNGILLYSDNSHSQMLLIVTDDGHEKVKEWWKQNRHTFST